MVVLGLSHDLWISSAAIVIDGKVEAAVAEERLNREKKYKGFPSLSVDYCLKATGLKIEEVDLVVNGWNPTWHLQSLHPRFSSQSRWRPEYLYSIPNYLFQKTDNLPKDHVEQIFHGFHPKILYIDHHIAHAASSYYLSPFEKSAFLILDGQAERHTGTYGYFDKNEIVKLDYVNYPHSLGLFYGTITQYLGFKPDSDEWKVMALASYGSVEDNKFYNKLKKLITVDSNGVFKINLDYFGFHQPDVFGSNYYSNEFKNYIGIPMRNPDEPLTRKHKELAWACQRLFEDTVNEILAVLHKRTESDNLIISGGCFMNSVYNGKIIDQTPFKNIYIGSCPDDSGISVGAALWGYYHQNNDEKRKKHIHNYWGPEYGDQIENTLIKYKLDYEKLEDPAVKGAKLISEGKIIGWYQGRMEFGQRALGNRSILADPRNKRAKDLVNLAVKFRESFRPFAPSILAERVEEYFVTSGDSRVNYMEKVLQFKKEVISSLPAVVHVDGSGRLHTVDEQSNLLFYRLIKAFDKITGIPIVLNTSFNLNGEAIVCTPNDAIRTFFSCGLDNLIIGNYLLSK
jgi:carbamoyltransferase